MISSTMEIMPNQVHILAANHFLLQRKHAQHHIQDMHLEASTGLQGSANDDLLAFKMWLSIYGNLANLSQYITTNIRQALKTIGKGFENLKNATFH